jgi:hypothetical protein
MPLTLAAATALILGLGGHATAQQPVDHDNMVKIGELNISLPGGRPEGRPGDPSAPRLPDQLADVPQPDPGPR